MYGGAGENLTKNQLDFRCGSEGRNACSLVQDPSGEPHCEALPPVLKQIACSISRGSEKAC